MSEFTSPLDQMEPRAALEHYSAQSSLLHHYDYDELAVISLTAFMDETMHGARRPTVPQLGHTAMHAKQKGPEALMEGYQIEVDRAVKLLGAMDERELDTFNWAFSDLPVPEELVLVDKTADWSDALLDASVPLEKRGALLAWMNRFYRELNSVDREAGQRREETKKSFNAGIDRGITEGWYHPKMREAKSTIGNVRFQYMDPFDIRRVEVRGQADTHGRGLTLIRLSDHENSRTTQHELMHATLPGVDNPRPDKLLPEVERRDRPDGDAFLATVSEWFTDTAGMINFSGEPLPDNEIEKLGYGDVHKLMRMFIPHAKDNIRAISEGYAKGHHKVFKLSPWSGLYEATLEEPVYDAMRQIMGSDRFDLLRNTFNQGDRNHSQRDGEKYDELPYSVKINAISYYLRDSILKGNIVI